MREDIGKATPFTLTVSFPIVITATVQKVNYSILIKGTYLTFLFAHSSITMVRYKLYEDLN